jgi:hypothetical protein
VDTSGGMQAFTDFSTGTGSLLGTIRQFGFGLVKTTTETVKMWSTNSSPNLDNQSLRVRDGWCQIFDNRLSNLVQAEIWGKNPKVSRAPGVKCQNGTTLNVKFQNRTTSGFHKMVVGTQNIDESDKGVWY